MEFTRDEVRAIAELAKLELTDAEITRYGEQLSKILGYFEHLSELDTSHIEATASVLPIQNVMRADVPKPALDPVEVIANAFDADENQFRVSAVLEE